MLKIKCLGPFELSQIQRLVLTLLAAVEQSGAVEACWAHNPEVRRSKLRSAKYIFQTFSHSLENVMLLNSLDVHFSSEQVLFCVKDFI